MRILLIGDIVGKPGREILARAMPGLRQKEQLDLVVANAENAAGGSGITPEIYYELTAAGIDCITLGDHAFRRREIFAILQSQRNIVRPGNYPDEAPGRGSAIVTARNRVPVAVLCLQGRVFMPPIDCPFRAAERLLANAAASHAKVVVVDFHAEATSDKQIMGRLLDGRATAVLGTHTHVPTADEQILPRGTAFQCDVGMTGPHESILGRRIDRVTETTRTFRPTHYDVAEGDVRINGTIVEADPDTGRAISIRRLCVDQTGANQLAASFVAK